MSATREQDIQQLEELLGEHANELSETEREAFTDMRAILLAYGTPDGRHRLTDSQRAWLRKTRERLIPQYENLVSRGLVPRGREVPTPPALQRLPLKPPRKRTED